MTSPEGFHSLHLVPQGDGVGGLSHFSEGLYSRDLDHIEILGGNWHFECWCFFSGGTWKFPVYIKSVNMNLKQTNKMILIVISTISHFWSSTLTTSWQSVFVSLFSMIYTPPPPPPPPLPLLKYFLCAAKIIFRIPSMTNHVNLSTQE